MLFFYYLIAFKNKQQLLYHLKYLFLVLNIILNGNGSVTK